MKRFFTIISAIAILVACNQNKRIVSDVPIKTEVLGIELCKQMTEHEIYEILEENTGASLWGDDFKLNNVTLYEFSLSSEYYEFHYGGFVWDHVCIRTSEESNVFEIQLQSVFESIETAKQQYDSAVNIFSKKYGNGNSLEQSRFWTDDTNLVVVEYCKSKARDGKDRYYCILTYENIALRNEIEAKDHSDI